MGDTKVPPAVKDGDGPKEKETGAAEKKTREQIDIPAINDYLPDVFIKPGDSIILAEEAQEKPKEVPKEIPREVPKEIPREIPKEVPKEPSPERLERPIGDVMPKKPLTNEEVTGHTAGLWKYLPVPTSQPEPAPEYLHHFIQFPGSQIIAARVRGKKHKHEGTNCDDWYEVANLGNITLMAVSDGAGSKKFSRIGARESCKAAVGYLAATLKGTFADKPQLREAMASELSDPRCMEACGVLAGIVQGSVMKAIEAVEAAYYSRAADSAYRAVLGRELEFKDLSGTLLVAVLIPVKEGTREHLVVSCQVGDGMIALFNTEGGFSSSVKLMGVPDSGDFSGETEFLTSSLMRKVESLQSRTKISRSVADLVMVMSDGVADDYFPNETEMHRLYFDLAVNGILEGKGPSLTFSSLTKQQIKLLKRIPDPLAYPWVNDQKTMVAIQYTKRICQSTGLSLEDLWNDPTALALARLELEEEKEAVDPGRRLEIWLDNYVERGSFDDRTLVVARL